ncbi:hypothetical protein TorRG33x02_146650, partial [Trema orientale]
TTTDPDPDPGGGASTRLGSKIFDRSRTCPTTSPGCSDHFSTGGRKISTLVENFRLGSNHRSTGVEPPFDRRRTIRLGSKPPVENFDRRSTTSLGCSDRFSTGGWKISTPVENVRLGSNHCSTVVENVRLGSKPPVENFDRRSTVVENFDPSRT